jgi:hypothetical protein
MEWNPRAIRRWILSRIFPQGIFGPELVPLTVELGGSQTQKFLCPVARPDHAAPLHSVGHHMPARRFHPERRKQWRPRLSHATRHLADGGLALLTLPMRLHAAAAGGNGRLDDHAEPRLGAARQNRRQPRTRHTIESAHPQRHDPQALSDRVEIEQDERSLRRCKHELTSW